jgi:hypothetical protein
MCVHVHTCVGFYRCVGFYLHITAGSKNKLNIPLLYAKSRPTH